MAEFLKPQSPIRYKKDDAFIYPLTTADQVILDDNKRLNVVLDDVVNINLDGAVEGEANPINADTLNGRAASEYALKSDLENLPSGGVSSWNDLTDKPDLFSGSWNDLTEKPFKETTVRDTLTWDGNTNGLVSIHGPYSNWWYYKVSDILPSMEDLANYVVVSNDGHVVTGSTFRPRQDELGIIWLGYNYDVMVVQSDTTTDDGYFIDTTFVEKGIYFNLSTNGNPTPEYPFEKVFVSSLKLNGYTGFTPTTSVKTIDDKYIPTPDSMHETTIFSDTLTWDGTMLNRFNGDFFVNISDNTPTTDDLANGFKLAVRDNFQSWLGSFLTEQDCTIEETAGCLVFSVDDTPVCFIQHEDKLGNDSRIWPKGIYINSYYITSISITGYTFKIKTSKLDKNYLPDISWKDLTDKPFGYDVVPSENLTWNGDGEGLESAFCYVYDSDDAYAYKVCDITPSIEDLANGYTVRFPGGYITTEQDCPVSTSGNIIKLANGYCFIAATEFYDREGKKCPKGIYFAKSDRTYYVESLVINGYTNFESIVVKELNRKYLPKVAQPINILDNSDFRKPVNQRGKTSYGAYEYGIDRWKADGAVMTVDNGCLTLSIGEDQGAIEQWLEPGTLKFGKAYTIAIKTTTDEVVVDSCVLDSGWYGGGLTTYTNWGYVSAHCGDEETDQYVRIHLSNANSSVSFEWVALYEGEFTAATLPDYQPKGYAVELAECLRYFETRDMYFVMSNGHAQEPVFFKATKRVVPSITVYPDHYDAMNYNNEGKASFYVQSANNWQALSANVSCITYEGAFFEAIQSNATCGSFYLEISAEL